MVNDNPYHVGCLRAGIEYDETNRSRGQEEAHTDTDTSTHSNARARGAYSAYANLAAQRRNGFRAGYLCVERRSWSCALPFTGRSKSVF